MQSGRRDSFLQRNLSCIASNDGDADWKEPDDLCLERYTSYIVSRKL